MGLRERDPEAARALDRAIKLRDAGRYSDALTIVDTLIEQHPEHPALWGIKGGLHWLQGERDPAAAAFRRTLAKTPSSQLASLSLAAILTEQGRLADARQELERFLQDYESDEHRAELAHLDEIESEAGGSDRR